MAWTSRAAAQSPAKQIDEFVHDLIERHIHVRRRFGLPLAHLRIFDRFERNPEEVHPLILKRVELPKRPMGLYESTVLDRDGAANGASAMVAATDRAAPAVPTRESAPR